MNRFIAVIAISLTAFLFVIPAWAQAVSAVTLTNGPPNIPNASPCTMTTCAWIGAGWPSGTHVSLVYADMTPISTNYTGSFSLSDQPGHTGDSSHFSISTASDGTRNVGEVKTSGTVAAGDYFITVTAVGASGANTQNVTVHAASGANVACGAGIPTSGTVLLSPNCTYSFTASNGTSVTGIAANTVFIGVGNGSTIFDGTNTQCFAMDIENNPAPGAAVIGIQFQNYSLNCGIGVAIIQTGESNVVRNSRFINTATKAINVSGGGALIANNYVNHLGGRGITPNGYPTSSSSLTTIIGNEIADTNYTLEDTCNDADSMKITGHSWGLLIKNNYFHDNKSSGPWSDYYSGTGITMTGNTLVRDGGSAMQWEQTRASIEADHNVMVHEGDDSNTGAFYCGNTFPPPGASLPTMFINGSGNVNLHDNNESVFTVGTAGQAFQFTDEIGNGTGFVGNNTVHDNTVNFFTRDASSRWGWDSSSEDTSGSSSNNNHFHLIGGDINNDAHWYWFNQGNTAQTFANYRSSGQDANSTIDTTDASTTGCTHVACSGSGIGAGGVPLRGASGLSMQSLALSNFTFTPNVANGVVGTVSVTMSDGSTFSGKLSITGANSGGFQLSGNTLEEKASGTPAGTYHDFNIVATQSTASNSPQQISPTMTGVVDAPFGGKARSITNRIQAEDFDVGGYGVAYRATDVCGIGIDTAYGSDRLNVYPTADVDGASNLKIGCNQVGDWHNYTITAAMTGAYTLNVRVANIEAGATYHVAIDGATVVSGIAVPNTGGYDTFATVTSKQFGLTAGQHVMQVVLDTSGSSGFGGEFNWTQGTLVKAGAIGAKNIDITVTH